MNDGQLVLLLWMLGMEDNPGAQVGADIDFTANKYVREKRFSDRRTALKRTHSGRLHRAFFCSRLAKSGVRRAATATESPMTTTIAAAPYAESLAGIQQPLGYAPFYLQLQTAYLQLGRACDSSDLRGSRVRCVAA